MVGSSPNSSGEIVMPPYEPALSLVGRLLLAGIFVWAGTLKIFNPEGTQHYMAAYGLTFGTMLLYLGATLVEIAGGVSLALGYLTREAAFMLVAFMVVVTGIFHTHLVDANQIIHLLKNVAIIGGLLYVAAYGPGAISPEAQMGMPSDDDAMRPYRSRLSLAGRMFIAAIFLVSGSNKLLDPQGTQQYMAAMGIVSATGLFYAAAVGLELGGALVLVVGAWARIGAGALVLFMIPATVMFHRTSMSFVIDAAVQDQQFHLMKNLAIMGGLLYVLAYGADRIALNARQQADPEAEPSKS
jgi:putative oxidoreductase